MGILAGDWIHFCLAVARTTGKSCHQEVGRAKRAIQSLLHKAFVLIDLRFLALPLLWAVRAAKAAETIELTAFFHIFSDPFARKIARVGS